VPGGIEVAVILPGLESVALGGDNGRLAGQPQGREHAGLGVVALVGDHDGGRGRSSSAPARSWAWPGVRQKCRGLPRASTVAWIVVLSPPLLRPSASASGPPFFCARAVLVRPHDGRVQHRVFVVRVCAQVCEHPLPHVASAPAGVPQMHHPKVAEARRQVAPGNAGAGAVEHRLHEEAVVLRRSPNRRECLLAPDRCGALHGDMDSSPALPVTDVVALSALAARVLGCLIEKQLATPDIYPLTLNALVNACNQKSNREPVLEVSAREVEVALDELGQRRLAVAFAGAEARVTKYRQKMDEVYYPLEPTARAVLGELLLRGAQTAAGLRGNAERLHPMPAAGEFELLLAELAGRPAGALVRKLPRQPGQKEARWVQLLTGEPALESGAGTEPVTVTMTLPPEAERRLAALESELGQLRAELVELKKALGA
jgi:uncharacterized protein YceH (UPF0502 family)